MKALVLGATCLLLLGCASSNPRYYSLQPEGGPVLRGPRQVVVVRGASVAQYLQRNEIVRQSENGRVAVEDNDWWSETLRTMLQRVLAADLQQRLPDADVLGTETLGGEGATVTLAVERFESRGDGILVLDGFLAVEAGRDRVLRRVALETPIPGRAIGDQVKAMSRALGQAADIAATALARRGAG